MDASRHAVVAKAIGANLGLSVVAMGVQVVLAGVLARVLHPADYGVFAFANAIMVYIAHLTQRGLSSALVRKPVLDADDLGDAYIGCACMAALVLLAMFAVFILLRLLSGPVMRSQAEVMLFMAAPLAVQIIATPATTLMQRRLRFSAINIISLVSILFCNGGVTIACSLAGLGPWSLAIGNAANVVMSSALNFVAAREPARFAWRPDRIRAFMRDGVAFNGLRSLDVAWLQVPIILFGFLAPAAQVGIYQRMQYMADLVMQMTVWRVSGVLYSALAPQNVRHRIDKARYRMIFSLMATLVIPIAAFVASASGDIVDCLLGRQWRSGAYVLSTLAIAFGLSTLNQAAGMTLEHSDHLKRRYASAGTALVLITPLILVFSQRGLNSFGYPALISVVLASVVLHAMVGERPKDLGALLFAATPGICLGAAAAYGVVLGGLAMPFLPSHTPLLRLACDLAGAGLLCLLMTPLALRANALSPFVGMFRQNWPGLYGRTAFLHGGR